MVHPKPLFLCPSCSCHARRDETECPHCGAALTRQAGTPTQRSMAAMAMGLALAVALPVAACGDDTGGGSGGGGGAGGSGGSGGSGPTSTSSPSSSSGDGGGGDGGASSSSSDLSAVSTYGVAVSSSSSGSACLDEPFFEDPTCDSCAQDFCCAEIQACLADPANCADAEGFLDPNSSLGGPLLECLDTECAAVCGGNDDGGICDSGLTTQDPATDECLGAACCVEFNTCTSNSADIDACIACFDAGGGPLCDAAIACGEESCAN